MYKLNIYGYLLYSIPFVLLLFVVLFSFSNKTIMYKHIKAWVLGLICGILVATVASLIYHNRFIYFISNMNEAKNAYWGIIVPGCFEYSIIIFTVLFTIASVLNQFISTRKNSKIRK